VVVVVVMRNRVSIPMRKDQVLEKRRTRRMLLRRW